jgi:outer membrane protein assembly factor BamB
VPCNSPPWGVLTTIDLEPRATKWERPFGSIPALASNPASHSWGSPSLGGAKVSVGGLVFAGGAVDQRLHAFDVETGAELWSAELPAGVHGSPMTYVTPSGEQYVVVAAGGHRELRDKAGDYIVAFALRGLAREKPRAPPLTSARYDGHIILDRSRLPLRMDLTVSGSSAAMTFETSNPHIEGNGKGRATRDSVVVDATWTFPAQHCSGTIQLRGTSANDGHALIGELEYLDGCSGHRVKPGTFAVYK